MGFFAPWFLAGMAAIGLPLWLHLLRQHRSVPRRFSSLMFFERRTQASIKHRKLRYLLLLALRMAILILLALAFANPYVARVAPPGNGRRLVVVALDRSFSMRYGDHFARAKREALAALASIHPGDLGQVIGLSSRVQVVTQPTSDVAQLRAALNLIQPGDGHASFGDLARSLKTIAQASHLPAEVHLASDFQKSALPPAFRDLAMPPDTRLVLHSVADPSPNWTVESVTAPRRIYETKKVRVQATVAGFGTPAATRTVSLVLNGKTLATKSVDVPANGRASVEFLSLDAPYGFSRGEVRIDSADRLKEDDRFLFTVERSDPRKVLFVHEARDLRSPLYFETALESASESAFQIESVTADQAAALALSKYAFVVLSDVGVLPPSFEDGLKRWVSAGGSVLVALGPNSAARARLPVFDEAIGGSRYSSREGERFQIVGQVDEAHPALARAERFEGVRFYQVTKFEPGSSQILARLSDGTPLIAEKKIGEGRVLVLGSTLDNLANDLPLHASFVPFVEQTSNYLGGLDQQPANVKVDSYVELRTGPSGGAAAEVLDPDGKRALSLEESTKARNFAVTREGYYEIRRADGRREMLAVHADRRESDLTPIPAETLALWKATGRGDVSAPGASSPAGAPAARPWGFWPYIILVLLVVSLVESVVADRYLGVVREPDTDAEQKEAA